MKMLHSVAYLLMSPKENCHNLDLIYIYQILLTEEKAEIFTHLYILHRAKMKEIVTV